MTSIPMAVVLVLLMLMVAGCGVAPEQGGLDTEQRDVGTAGPDEETRLAELESATAEVGTDPDPAELPDVPEPDGQQELAEDLAEDRDEAGVTPDPIVWHVLWGERFDDVEDMARVADLVVTGRVVDHMPDVVDGSRVIYRDLVIEIDELLHGDLDAGRVVMQQVDRDPGSGHDIVIDGLTRFAVGDELLVFLVGTDSSGEVFEPVNVQGAHRVVDGRLEVTDRDDPLIRSLEGTALDELVEAVSAR